MSVLGAPGAPETPAVVQIFTSMGLPLCGPRASPIAQNASHQPPAQALDAEIAEMQNAKQDAESWAVIVQMTRAIEAAHGIK